MFRTDLAAQYYTPLLKDSFFWSRVQIDSQTPYLHIQITEIHAGHVIGNYSSFSYDHEQFFNYYKERKGRFTIGVVQLIFPSTKAGIDMHEMHVVDKIYIHKSKINHASEYRYKLTNNREIYNESVFRMSQPKIELIYNRLETLNL